VEMYEFNANASSFPSEMSLVIATERPDAGLRGVFQQGLRVSQGGVQILSGLSRPALLPAEYRPKGIEPSLCGRLLGVGGDVAHPPPPVKLV
jgi:hypothetical protein